MDRHWKVLKDLLWLFCSEEKVLVNNSGTVTVVKVKTERFIMRSVGILDSHSKALMAEMQPIITQAPTKSILVVVTIVDSLMDVFHCPTCFI